MHKSCNIDVQIYMETLIKGLNLLLQPSAIGLNH